MPGGVYGGDTLAVTLSAEGPVYYTLDGRVPDESCTLLTGPPELRESTVLRAVCIPEGCLPGRVLSLTYLLGEDEPMDVLAIAVDPEAFAGEEGVFTGSDKEKTCLGNLSLYEEGGGFSLDCEMGQRGNKVTGFTQKGLNFVFHGGLGGLLRYPLGEEKRLYHSLLIRSGESRYRLYIADPVFTALARDCCTALPVQDCRYVSVYVNAEYYGLYQLRDRFSRRDLAERWDVDGDSVEIVRFNEREGTELGELFDWAAAAPLSDPETYEQLAGQVDLEALAEWFLIQSSSGNIDTLTNIKFARSAQYDGRWHILLYDLDRAAEVPSGLYTVRSTTAVGIPQLFNDLLRNDSFRTLLAETLSYMLHHGLTTERLLAEHEALYAQVEQQMLRSLERWEIRPESFVSANRDFLKHIRINDPQQKLTDTASEALRLSAEEQERYFG